MKARVFWLVVIAALVGVVGFKVVQRLRQRGAAGSASGVELALIRTAKVTRADMSETLGFTGSIRPRNEVDVYPKVPGRAESLPIAVGDKVRAGQVLAVVEHKEIAWQAKAAQAALKVAKAGVDGAQLEHDRTMALYKGGSATSAMADGAKIKLSLAQAQYAQAEAAVGLAEQALSNATIVAPIAGTVTRRPVNVGTQLGQSTPVCTIQDLAALKLEASVDAFSYGRLQKGAAAQIRVDALAGESFSGVLTVLSPSLDAITRRAALEVEVDNTSGRLLPNMFARAELKVGELKSALAVPRNAVFEAAGGPVVFRIKDGKAELIRARLGPIENDRVAVIEGLAEGDEVAVSGLPSLADGTPVKVAVSD